MILRGGIPRSIRGLPRRLDSEILSLRVLSGTRPVPAPVSHSRSWSQSRPLSPNLTTTKAIVRHSYLRSKISGPQGTGLRPSGLRLSGPQAITPSGHQVLSGPQAIRLSQALRPSGSQALRLSGSRALRLSGCWLRRRAGRWAARRRWGSSPKRG